MSGVAQQEGEERFAPGHHTRINCDFAAKRIEAALR
jgi:hypothetical protein